MHQAPCSLQEWHRLAELPAQLQELLQGQQQGLQAAAGSS
jgi:hypothetical protein